jgi:uncharacterized protein YdhG (YjbR/CyaY superfamily)
MRIWDYHVELFANEDITICFDQDNVHVKVDPTGGGISQNDRKIGQINFWPYSLSKGWVLNFIILGGKPVS